MLQDDGFQVFVIRHTVSQEHWPTDGKNAPKAKEVDEYQWIDASSVKTLGELRNISDQIIAEKKRQKQLKLQKQQEQQRLQSQNFFSNTHYMNQPASQRLM